MTPDAFMQWWLRLPIIIVLAITIFEWYTYLFHRGLWNERNERLKRLNYFDREKDNE